ncbi:MAG: GIY-YIG nuclease family protein [Oscillospiraceae bacterium]|nr:GIY-YIG nuclease family protein [Oscillospiraceae bacterium]
MPVKNYTGVIYILTNPSFPNYIKIGYATDLEKRLKQLNRTEREEQGSYK